MSVKTWMEEFYPTPANKCVKTKAILHSIRKWTGLLPKNLEKHGVYLTGSDVCDDAIVFFSFDCETCALCQHYWVASGTPCAKCPLAIELGGPCDAYNISKDPERRVSAFGYIFEKDPTPMLAGLKKALATQQRIHKKWKRVYSRRKKK